MITRKKAAAKSKPRRAAARIERPAGRRAQNKAAIRKRIVTAALSLFQSKGFDATTTKAIARKAGIAEGTVFNYFRTKEDIALHFFEQEVDQAIASVRENPRLRKAPLEEKLFALVHSQFEFLAPHEKFIGAAFIHALKPASPLGMFSHRAQELRHRYVGFVQELLDESLPKNQHSPLSFLAPEVFWIYYLGALLYWLHDSSPGKQHTLAFLDRSLSIGVSFLQQGKR
ncbi:MAG: TetR family transcriptional regulator [Pyrinomonadaceae bacterium]